MEVTLRFKIIESLLRESAIEDLERIARRARDVHLEMVSAVTAFVRLCGVLQGIKEEYGEEAFRGVIGVLGLDEQLVQLVHDQVSKVPLIPTDRLKLILRTLAVNTARQIGLVGGSNGNPGR